MLLEEKDKAAFKQWLLPKLESISDAEAGVLADYVIALITVEGPQATVKQDCVAALGDFLQDHAGPFVDEVASAIEQRSWAPREAKANAPIPKTAPPVTQPTIVPFAAPIPSIGGSTAEPYLPSFALSTDTQPNTTQAHITDGAVTAQPSSTSRPKLGIPDRPNGPSPSNRQAVSTMRGHELRGDWGNRSRKRKNDGWETSQEGLHQTWSAGDRPFKKVARRDFGSSGSGFRANSRNGTAPVSALVPTSMLPAAPSSSFPVTPGFPPIDPTNPMAFVAAMAALLGVPLAGTSTSRPNTSKPKLRCTTYDTQGFCLLGSACPYEHGGAQPVPEYDPNNAALAAQPRTGTNRHSNTHRGRGRNGISGKGRSLANSGGRSYLQAGHTNTTLVVDHIPEENFSEDEVRNFFTQFGRIAEVKMDCDDRRAIVNFKEHDAAQRAYDSPQAFFGNRFVKVYWHKPEHLQSSIIKITNGVRNTDSESHRNSIPEIYTEDAEMIDLEEVRQRQLQAQQIFEEKRKKIEEATARAEEIDRQLKTKEQEMRGLKVKLVKKARAKGVDFINTLAKDLSDDSLLMGDLTTLQAEAQGLYARHDASPATQDRDVAHGLPGRGQGRHTTRGRGYTSFRGYGRGYAGTRCGVRRLDNRPKRLAIADVEAGSPRDEALRQYFFNVPGCEDVYMHTERPNTLVVSFAERYMAEMFRDQANRIPDVGNLKLYWVPNGTSVVIKPPADGPPAPYHDADDESSTGYEPEESNGKEAVRGEEPANVVELDLDVADDSDQWL